MRAEIARRDPDLAPAPLLLSEGAPTTELVGDRGLPLGLGERERTFRRSYRRLEPTDRVVVYTDRISARTTSKGFFGIDGITRAARDAEAWTAHAMARAIQEAVAGASRRPLRDDAAVVVLAPAAESGRTPPTARSGGS